MAGRPQKRAVTRAAPRKPARPTPGDVLPLPRAADYDRTTASHAAALIPQRDVPRPPILLSRAYGEVLGDELTLRQADNAGSVATAVLRAASQRRGGRITVADAIAAALVRRVVDRTTRDGVTAAKELADRTEGTVLQKVTSTNVSFVVSLTPSGGPPGASDAPVSLDEWERRVKADPEAQRALPLSPPPLPPRET